MDESKKLVYFDNSEQLVVKIKNKKLYKENKEIVRSFIKLKNKKIYRKIFRNKKTWNLAKLFTRKIPNKVKYVHRLAREFQLIEYFNFVDVFLQVCEILYLAGNIPHIIRGSSGSCLLCYLLGITDIDPIKENICFIKVYAQRQSHNSRH